MMQQISMLTQQVSQISAQSVRLSASYPTSPPPTPNDRINSERDRRVMTLEQQAQQKHHPLHRLTGCWSWDIGYGDARNVRSESMGMR